MAYWALRRHIDRLRARNMRATTLLRLAADDIVLSKGKTDLLVEAIEAHLARAPDADEKLRIVPRRDTDAAFFRWLDERCLDDTDVNDPPETDP